MDPRIADYIRANRRRYTREAITQQLVAAGHDPAEIERVWAALDTPDADTVAGEGFWARFALILVGINVAVFLLVGFLTGMLQNLSSGSFLLVILAVAMAIGALIAWGLVAATGPTKLGRTTALVIGAVIPLLFAALIGGTCFALVGAIGAPGPPPINGVMQVRLGAPLETDQEASATCQPAGGAGEGFFVNAGFPGPEGMHVDVSVNSFPQGPGGRLETSLWVSAYPTSDTGLPLSWGNDMGPGGITEIDVSDDGLNGSVRFEGLPAMPMEGGKGESEPTAGEPLSGEISWTCE